MDIALPRARNELSTAALRSLLDQLSLAVFVFRRERLIYTNPPASRLVERLRRKYQIELLIMLVDHLAVFRERAHEGATALTLTARGKEPFFVHLLELAGRHDDVAVSVREIGKEISSFKERYQLSDREVEVTELVLHGYRNRDIAAALGITVATTKKHLCRVFDKVGVDSRAQLVSRLA
jgi:DNA-binding CsgD family transcriptional regulator